MISLTMIVAAWAATVTPGSAVIKPLVHVNVHRLSYAGRVDALAALERQRSWIDAQQLRLLAVMAADPPVKSPTEVLDKEWLKEDVACALRLSAQTAADRLEFAKAMTRLLPDTGATTFMTAVDALARRVPCDDDRTADQRRADAVVQLALNTLHGSVADELPREHGLRRSVQVTVALSTLLGLDEQPGELAGSGPIPASVARRIAADQTGT